MDAHGRQAALAHFGLEKAAIDWSGLWSGVRSSVVGEPRRAWQQVQDGSYLGPKGLVREYAWPSHPNVWAQRAMRAGALLPLINVGQQVFGGRPEDRGSRVGGAIGGVVGATLGAPFGVLGNIAGGLSLGTLGSHIGSAFDEKPRMNSYPFVRPEEHHLS